MVLAFRIERLEEKQKVVWVGVVAIVKKCEREVKQELEMGKSDTIQRWKIYAKCCVAWFL